jgi:hypothetical protein
MARATIKTFADCRWSDGRAVTSAEKKRLVAMRNNPRTRLPAILIETDSQWWLRVRGVLEGAFIDPREQRGDKQTK